MMTFSCLNHVRLNQKFMAANLRRTEDLVFEKRNKGKPKDWQKTPTKNTHTKKLLK